MSDRTLPEDEQFSVEVVAVTDHRTENEKLTGRDAVLRMRDEFLQLVNAYNTTGNYEGAMDAQAVAILLNRFEDDHHITNIAWPARVKGEGHDVELVEVDQ